VQSYVATGANGAIGSLTGRKLTNYILHNFKDFWRFIPIKSRKFTLDMNMGKPAIWFISGALLFAGSGSYAQGGNDTIRLGAVMEHGQVYPMILLPEFTEVAVMMPGEEKNRRNKLRSDVYQVYPYALAAATIFKDVNTALEKIPDRRDRKKYLKSVDKQLDHLFKEPLKNLSIDQGHILIKLINRQTGTNCYRIIKELKGGFNAVVWQSVGLVFNNNLNRDYDPFDRDKEVEGIVRDLEASNNYRYQLYQQQALLSKVKKP